MNKKFRFHLCLAGLLVFSMGACKVEIPEEVIPESEMENLLYDYHLAKSMGDNLPYAENYKKVLYIDAVFKKYGTTQAAFDSSMVWYTRNTLPKCSPKSPAGDQPLETGGELVGDMIAKRDKKPKMDQPGRQHRRMAWKRLERLTGQPMNSAYVFTLPTDSNYKDRDTLVWSVRYQFLQPVLPDSLRNVTMAMQVIYDKDTVSRWTTVRESGVHHILSACRHARTGTKEIRGFIYYPVEKDRKAGTLLTDRFSMMRYHCTDTLPFAVRDSLNKAAALRTDSIRRAEEKPEQTKVEQPVRKNWQEQQNMCQINQRLAE